MTRPLHLAAFVTGLIAIAWVGAGYLPGNPVALALVLLIGAFYAAGALELHRFRQATAGLVALVDGTMTTPPSPGEWVAPLHPSLQQPVRLRAQGERVALPGPALTPYLAGLLVLLGMLGTFLGMVITLKGTGLALENATDIQAIRASLAAPVQGLGLAFGCSVAGVAASAMLGLMSALARRERQQAAQALDACIATALRSFSPAHRQAESLRLQQAQADALQAVRDTLPLLATQLQALTAQMAQQGQALHEGLMERQAAFHGETQRAYTALAASVDRSLQHSLAEGARLAAQAIEPAVQRTMDGLVQQSNALHDTLGAAVQRQLDGVGARLDAATSTLAQRWQAALAEQQRHGEARHAGLQAALAGFAQTFETRSAALVDGISDRLERSDRQAAATWRDALGEQRQAQAALVQQTQATMATTVAAFEQHAAALLAGVAEAHAALDAGSATREAARLAAFHDGLGAMTDTLRRDAQAAADAVGARQQQICTTLEQTAQAITTQAEAQARATIAEITRLVAAASEAPRAAAEVIGELRSALSDSLVRDTAMLDERNRLMATLGGLLDAVQHAGSEQRAAIDALVQATSDVLVRVGARFADTVEAESRTLQTVAAQVSGSAAEVASLGEGFGVAVQLFAQSSQQLGTQLQRIETALGQSMARSDEQLAYYVAQAREIIDLTLGSQKQIVDDLQQLGRAVAAPAAAAAA